MVVISYYIMVILGGISSQEPSACLLQDNIKWRKLSTSCPAEEERLEIVEKKSILVILLGLLGTGSVLVLRLKLYCFSIVSNSVSARLVLCIDI